MHNLLAVLWTIVVVAGYIVLLVAIWRLMRAHESVAESLKELAQKMDQRQE
jgi:cytochrome bd-type quinol oxidase subunit 2